MTSVQAWDSYATGARPRGSRRGGAPVALSVLLAVLGALAVAGTTVLVVWTHLGQRADERSRWSIAVPREMRRFITAWLDTVSIEFIVLALAVAVLLALIRRRLGAALAALALVAGANITTQVLKDVIPRPEYGVGPAMNSLPSGHTTVLTSIALALVIVAPRALRPLLVLATTTVATFTGAATILERWHRPSDVIAAFGVCALWAGPALGALAVREIHSRRAAGAPPGPGVGRRFAVHLCAGVVGAVLVGAVLVVGGLVSQGAPLDVAVGGVMLTATGLTGALLAALVGTISDAVEPATAPAAQPLHGHGTGHAPGGFDAGRRPEPPPYPGRG